MKLHFSISLKLTIIVVALSASVIFSLALYNINEQAISFENIYVDKARDIANIIDASVINSNNKDQIHSTLQSINSKNTNIQYIDIFLQKNQSTKIQYSTNSSHINTLAGIYTNLSIETNKQVKISSYQENKDFLLVITPINSTENITGTYQILFLIGESYHAFEQKTTNLLLISFVSLFILIFSFLYLLRKTIVTPIIRFRDTAKQFGKGKLESRITITSKDEIGELANAFNNMAHDLKQSRDKIEEYNKILERLIDQKDAFIGQLGHDLKNPLQPLIGLLPILIEQEKDPALKEHLKVLDENAKYMKELIFKTLELAKLRSENITFDFTSLNLKDVIEKTILSQKILLDKHQITIENQVQNDIWVYADNLRLIEVIKNLITNAIKYSPEENGMIEISVIEQKKDVIVSIKDNGIGMTSEQIKNIFDEFYRAYSSRKGLDSTGLGLSISKKIIEKHDGKIWAESQGPNKGSTFKFTLKKGKK